LQDVGIHDVNYVMRERGGNYNNEIELRPIKEVFLRTQIAPATTQKPILLLPTQRLNHTTMTNGVELGQIAMRQHKGFTKVRNRPEGSKPMK
jgi:hypothetical protein